MNTRRYIPVAEPALVGNEKEYVLDCLESTWISSNGKYINRFETSFAEYCQVPYAISCNNGTAALHLALLALGIGPGDEVIIPTLTFVATANAVTYCGAKPIFVDSEPQTWNMDPEKIEEKITPSTRAIIAVHLYGHPADLDPITALAQQHGLYVIEDAAEAHGGEYKGRRVGSLSDVATFSFYGNKIITTGEGGMVTTSDDSIADKVRMLKGQGMDPHNRYWFPIVGYNYRMTNIAAAIGLAQLENIDWHVERRREIAAHYAHRLGEAPGIRMQPELPWAKNVFWMNSIVLEANVEITRERLATKLATIGVETRPFFYPMHTLPMYQDASINADFPVADWLARRGLNLPSSATLSPDDVDYICDQLLQVLDSHSMQVN